MSGFSGASANAENRARVAMIKRRVSVDDAINACDLVTDEGAECPACGAAGTIRDDPPRGGMFLSPARRVSDSSTCGGCSTTFDAISIVRTARGLSLVGACEFLERECLSKSGRRKP